MRGFAPDEVVEELGRAASGGDVCHLESLVRLYDGAQPGGVRPPGSTTPARP